MKTCKKWVKAGTGLAVIIAVISIAAVIVPEPEKLHIEHLDFQEVEDGSYTGEAENSLVSARVRVEIVDGNMREIEILEHDHLMGKRAEVLADTVVEEQSLDVDVVTSATYSSEVILKAVELALQKGRNGWVRH